MIVHTCPHCGNKRETAKCPHCAAVLDENGICPALCHSPPKDPPAYTGPAYIGTTHIGRMARGHG